MKEKNCKLCCRTISEEVAEQYNGYCKNCYEETQRKAYDDEGGNGVANAIKRISVLLGLCGFIGGLIALDEMEAGMGITIIIASVISSIFMYGFGEIIQLLEDIKNK